MSKGQKILKEYKKKLKKKQEIQWKIMCGVFLFVFILIIVAVFNWATTEEPMSESDKEMEICHRLGGSYNIFNGTCKIR